MFSQKAPSPPPPPYMQTETYFTKLNVEEEEEEVLFGRLCITNRHWLRSGWRRCEKVEFKVVCVKAGFNYSQRF